MTAHSNREDPQTTGAIRRAQIGLPYQRKESRWLDLKSLQRLGKEGMAASGLGTSPAQAPQEHIGGSSPRLSWCVCLPISPREGGHLRLSGEGEDGYGISGPGICHRAQELLPNSTKPPPPLPLSPIFPRVFLSRVGTILRGGREGRYDDIREHSRKIKWKLRGWSGTRWENEGWSEENESNSSTLFK